MVNQTLASLFHGKEKRKLAIRRNRDAFTPNSAKLILFRYTKFLLARIEGKRESEWPETVAVETIDEDITLEIQEVDGGCGHWHLPRSIGSRPKFNDMKSVGEMIGLAMAETIGGIWRNRRRRRSILVRWS